MKKTNSKLENTIQRKLKIEDLTLMSSNKSPIHHSKKYCLTYLAFLFTFLSLHNCQYLKAKLIKVFTPEYKTEDSTRKLKPIFNGKDTNRPKINIYLQEIFQSQKPTDIQFPPGTIDTMLVLEKQGKMLYYNWKTNQKKIILEIDVIYQSEQGLLGLAFHPNFQKNGLFYLNYSIQKEDGDYSRVEEWKFKNPYELTNSTVNPQKILMDVKQPYANHNAGQLAFGQDGMLYIGWGDGGWRADPENNGQNSKTFLGSMLRIDVDQGEAGKPYSIPSDNPFVNNKRYQPEIWAIGLRNPWRYSFAPNGSLIVADVGQDKWEEIDIVEKGKNYGWNHLEGKHCFLNENCDKTKFTPPIYEYSREEGNSITGGYVYTGKNIKELSNKYIFGDFITGRIWAFNLPESSEKKVEKVYTLGKWNILVSSFGRDNAGEIYVADYQSGKIFRMENAK